MQKIPFQLIQKCINKDDFDFPTLIYDGDLRTPKTIAKYKILKLEREISGKVAEQTIREELFKNGEIFELEKAKFPYDLIDIRFHYILWVNSKDPQVIKKAIEFEKAKFAGENYIYFQNEPKNKSVPEITHFHFLVK